MLDLTTIFIKIEETRKETGQSCKKQHIGINVCSHVKILNSEQFRLESKTIKRFTLNKEL